MADEPTTTPETEPAVTGEATQGTGSTPPATDKAPKWEGNFDPDRAARLVENLRAELAETKSKLKTREDAEKSEAQKLAERAEAAEKELAQERKVSAVKAHKLPASLAPYLTGSTAAEIEASAKALAEELGIHPGAEATEALPGRPRPRLVPGNGSDDGAEPFDAAKVAAAARRH
jgi:hypothetical protein